jgi:hypothetical protein
MSTTTSLLALWKEARTRFSNQLSQLNEDDLKRKLPPIQIALDF